MVFVGHPIVGTQDDFEDLGMRLKKNNVAIDVINFANPDNVGRLQMLVNTTNSGGEAQPNCCFLDVPPGCNNITDMMITSPILQSEDMGGAGSSMGGGAGMMIDPNMDPELAMALRMSMED